MTTFLQRLCHRPSPIPFTLGVGAGVAVGVATHDLATWLAVGAGLGIAFDGFASSRPCVKGPSVPPVG